MLMSSSPGSGSRAASVGTYTLSPPSSNPKPSHSHSNSNITISHVNINSITFRCRLDELSFFASLNSIDVLCLSETKLDDNVHPSLFSLDNFHNPLTRHRDRNGGGVAIYVRNNIPVKLTNRSGILWCWMGMVPPKNKRNNIVNPRPAGPLDFPPPAGGGGAFERPPPPPMISAPGRCKRKNERQRSKAREKSFRNHFGHFLAQVKIEVTRGQNSKIFQNGFSTIKLLVLKVEQWIWHHRVCLVKARRTIYKIIKLLWKVKVKVWPQVKSGQGHVMTEMGHIAYYWICLAKTNVLTPIPRLFLIKSYWQMTVGDLGWPQMTFRGVGNANFYANCPQLSYTIWFHSNMLGSK